jgi:hypothetical protein
LNFRTGETAHKLILSTMLCLISMVFLYLIRLAPTWAEIPLMALAGIPLSGIAAEEELYLSILAYAITAIFGLGFIASFSHLAPYTLLFGLYPLVKPFLDGRRDMFLRWVLKMLFFTAAMLLIADGASAGSLKPYLTHIPSWVLVPLVYVLFVAYDYILLLFQYFYLGTIRPRL